MSCSNSCLFNNQTSNASSSAHQCNGGINQVFVQGGLGGGTLTIEGSMDGGATWVPIKAISAAGLYSIPLPIGQYRGTLAGASGPTLTVKVYRDGDVNVVFP